MLLGSREAVAEAFVHTSVVSRLDSKSGSNVAESSVSPRGEADNASSTFRFKPKIKPLV